MTARRLLFAVFIALFTAGCATKPTVVLTPQEQYEPESVTILPMTPAAEAPPIDPVEPPSLPAAPPPEQPTAQRLAVPPEPLQEPPTNIAALVASPAPPAEPSEDQQLLALLADLQRYGAMSTDDLRRELANASAALGRQRSDANRVRLAVLYTMIRATPADDQRALQLFENVAKGNPGPTPIKQLAAVLQAQVTERQKAVRDEQQKADKVIQKLEALRDMERSLMRDRVRSGGGGGGAGGGAGGSGH
jgi:hypothetical protein